MDKKIWPTHTMTEKTHSRNKRSTETESKELEKNIPSNEQEKKAGVAILTSDKTDFKTQTVKGDTEGCFIILKGRSH